MTQTIKATEALTMIKNGTAILVDVREPDEFKSEHIAYALSVPLGTLADTINTLDIPADKTILFQCFKGTRGEKACDLLQGLDACKNKIVNIEGGIEAWKASGLPVIYETSSPPPKVSLFRQVQVIVGFLVAFCVVLGFLGATPAFALAGIFGVALFVAGLTGWCGLAMILAKMPWNK